MTQMTLKVALKITRSDVVTFFMPSPLADMLYNAMVSRRYGAQRSTGRLHLLITCLTLNSSAIYRLKVNCQPKTELQ